MRLTVSLAIVLALAMGGLAAYEYQRVPIKSHVVVTCSDPKHKGNTVIRDEIVPLTVPRKDRSGLLEHSWSIVCDVCRARNEAEAKAKAKAEQAKREREEREAREREEVSRIARSLVTRFRINGGKEASVRPGGGVYFDLNVENQGTEPISGLRILIRPARYLKLIRGYLFYNPKFDGRDARRFRLMTTTGSPIYDERGGATLFPANSSYYKGNTGIWTTGSNLARGIGFMNVDDAVKGGQEADLGGLVLSPSLTPGQDIVFEGLLLYKGHKILLGTLIVHVMYSKPKQE